MYALADCNTFYASCEKAFRPELWDKPVVVLSNNDGCMIALSKEAKALGLTMGTPRHMAKDLIKQHNVHVFSSNYELYGDMSARIMETLAEFAPNVEIYSIDEAFLDLDNIAGIDPRDFARELRETVTRNVGIPVSIGLAKTKTLAKAANRYAKRHAKDFNWAIPDAEEQERILRWMETGDIWGIGRRLSRRLAEMGIYTAWDLANADTRMIRKAYTVTGQRVQWELQGTRCHGLEVEKPKKEIICSRAYGKVIYEKWELEQSIAKYLARAAEKLRKQKCYAQHVSLYMEGSNRFKNEEPWEYGTRVGLVRPTSSTGEMIKACAEAVDRIWNELPHKPNPRDKTSGIRKAGVKLTDICMKNEIQLDMFAAQATLRTDEVMTVLDRINRLHGSETIYLAAQVNRPRQTQKDMRPTWGMRREEKSPNYTTRLEDMPVVHI